MKAYTDIEQSKKLAEILPLESADMYYHKDRYGEFVKIPHFNEEYKTMVDRDIVYNKDIIPCWSLTALLAAIPIEHSLHGYLTENGKVYRMETLYAGNSKTHDNPVDACVDMIIKLHEQNLL